MFIDSCAFDTDDPLESKAALEIFRLHEEGKLDLAIAHSTEKEIEHPNTPIWVKQKALQMFFTVSVSLTEEERVTLSQIEKILAGNGNVELVRSDAFHLFEAQKYADDFITADNGIWKKRQLIQTLCSIKIYKPSEYLELLRTRR